MSDTRVIYEASTGDVQMVVTSTDPARLDEAVRLNCPPGMAALPLAQRVPAENVTVEVTRGQPRVVVREPAAVAMRGRP